MSEDAMREAIARTLRDAAKSPHRDGAVSSHWLAQADAVLAVVRGVDADQGIPRYAMLDVWMALGGDSQVFDVWMAELRRSPADAWAQLLAAVKGDVVGLCSDTNPPAGELLDLLGVDADQWEQVGWSCVENRDHFSIERPTTPWAAGHLWEPVYRRVMPVVPAGEPCGYCDGSGFLSDPVQICGDCMGKGRVVPPRKAGLRRVPSPERWDIDADGHGLPPRIARVPVMNSAVVTPQQSMPPVTPRNILGFLRTLRRHQPPKGGGVMTCPRCGSTDRGERLSVPVPVDVPGLHTRCPDSWHRVPSTEPKEGP